MQCMHRYAVPPGASYTRSFVLNMFPVTIDIRQNGPSRMESEHPPSCGLDPRRLALRHTEFRR